MPTTPLGIVSPDGTNNYDLTVHLAAMGVSIDTAIQKYGNVQKGTSTQRAAAGAAAANGSLWVDTDGTKMMWRRDSTVAGNWAPAVMRWRGTTAQMNAFTQAPEGFEWLNSTDNTTYCRVGTAWIGDTFVQVGGVSKPISTAYSAINWVTSTPQLGKGNMVSSAQPTRITIPAKGVYRVTYNVRQNGITSSSSRVTKNGAAIPDGSGPIDAGANGAAGAAVTLGASGLMQLNVGDYLEVEVISSAATAGTSWLPGSTFSAQLLYRT